MYDGDIGVRRLADALESVVDDAERVEALAESLYYDVDQIKEDIMALLDEIERKR